MNNGNDVFALKLEEIVFCYCFLIDTFTSLTNFIFLKNLLLVYMIFTENKSRIL